MPEQDGSATKAVIIGPAAVAGVVLAVRAIRRRSYTSAVWALGLFGLEAGCGPYRRLLTGAVGKRDSEPAPRKSRNPDTGEPGLDRPA
jgi:hypothetical protein